MKVKFSDWLIFLVFGGLVFFHFRGFEAVEGTVFPQKNLLSIVGAMPEFPGEGNSLLLFILDFEDFTCLSCLDSFLALYRSLPSPFQTFQAWGVLIMKDRGDDWGRAVRIAGKKLRGFIRANRIAFPILVDRSRIFAAWEERGSGVLLFDGKRKMCQWYDFPLTGEQFEEIFARLTE